MRKKLIILGGIVLAIIIIFLWLDINSKVLKKMYPKQYSELVEKYSAKYDIDEEWVYALIKAESNFKKDSISSSGAIGLMQLMENTATEVADDVGITDIDLTEAETNIELGTKYFTDLLEYYNGNFYLAITAYNAGIGTVRRWITEGIIKEDGSDIENIPYKETNNYVRKILKNYSIYKELYK